MICSKKIIFSIDCVSFKEGESLMKKIDDAGYKVRFKNMYTLEIRITEQSEADRFEIFIKELELVKSEV